MNKIFKGDLYANHYASGWWLRDILEFSAFDRISLKEETIGFCTFCYSHPKQTIPNEVFCINVCFEI